MFTVAPLIGGCVSAVDDSTAFGFNGPQVPNVAGAATDLASPPTQAAADASGSTDAEPAETIASEGLTAEGDAIPTDVADATPPSPTEASSGSAEAETASATSDDAAPIASGRSTIAAYAGATVAPSSETNQPSAEGQKPKANNTLFASLFAQSEAKTPVRNSDSGKSQRVILKPEGAPVAASLMTPASANSGSPMDSLPGVKSRDSLFEIGQRASADYDAEILEEASGEEGTYEVASLSGMARLAPNGLMVQRPDVQTSCFEPKLVSMLRAVEQRFRTKVVVTSGYRSPSHNKRVSGARKSMHMACKAADIQVPGANKIEVANFLRALPGRGGVGTYCHTSAVHIDVGSQRDWNWACRRRRG